MSANLLPNGEQQFLDAQGNVLSGGLVYMYVPFTTTPKTTWVDQGQTTPNTNPIVLDATGKCIIWGSGTYRQLVTDSLGTLIFDQLTSDAGLESLQSQIDALTASLAALSTEVDTLNTEVAALQALGFQADYIFDSGAYTIKASDIEIFALGAGGGGSGTNSGGSTVNGGGAGATGYISLTSLTVGMTLTITVGTGGPGGGTGTGSGGSGSDTIIASGTQTITTLTAGGGAPGIYGGSPGIGGMATNFAINAQGNGGGVGIGGIAALYAPFGDGGSEALNGTVVNSVTIANQDGIQGLIVIRGVW